MKHPGFSLSDIATHIIKNCSQGFLTFDKDCIVKSDFKPEGSTFFDRTLSGNDILEILFHWFEPENNDSGGFDVNIDLAMIRDLLDSIFSRITQLDVLTGLLPNQLHYKKKSYSIDYQYLKSPEDKQYDLILIVFSETTAEKKFLRRIKSEINKHGMIIRIALDRNGYMLYREALLKSIHEIKIVLSRKPEIKPLSSLIPMLHGVQSGAEIYDLIRINSIALRIEKRIKSCLNHSRVPGPNLRSRILDDLELMEEVFTANEEKYLQPLLSGGGVHGDTMMLITSERLATLKNRLCENMIRNSMKKMEEIFEKNYKPFTRIPHLTEVTNRRLIQLKGYFSEYADQFANNTERLFEELAREPIGIVFQKYAILAKNYAKRLGKQIEVELIGEDITVPMYRFREFFNVLIHLVRNSIEHGLESMEERVYLGKPLEGKLVIEALTQDDNLILRFSDDGSGIDTEKVKQKAIEKKIIAENQIASVSKKEAIKLMFQMSGGNYLSKLGSESQSMGVGLAAVQRNIKKLHGNLSVQTGKEKGTTFKVTIPLK